MEKRRLSLQVNLSAQLGIQECESVCVSVSVGEGRVWLTWGLVHTPTPSYLMGVDNGDEPGEQAAEEGPPASLAP